VSLQQGNNNTGGNVSAYYWDIVSAAFASLLGTPAPEFNDTLLPPFDATSGQCEQHGDGHHGVCNNQRTPAFWPTLPELHPAVGSPAAA